MVTYSIKDLEKLSGIKAHTIRIWEQRYHIIDPKRTQTNIRYYTDDDLKCLLNIAFLNKNGLRISQIARMKPEDISKQVEQIAQGSFENTNQLQSLTMAMVELDEQKIEQIIAQGITQSGFDGMVQSLLIPFLEKLSLLWLTGSISTVHEQFVHNIFRQKLLVAIDQMPKQAIHHQSFMLYLPKGDNSDLEIILLLMQYLLRRYGFKVYYLGMGISIQDLALACGIHQPQYFYTILSESRTKPSLPEYLHKITTAFPQVYLLLSGFQSLGDLPDYPNMHVLENFDTTIDFLEELPAAALREA